MDFIFAFGSFSSSFLKKIKEEAVALWKNVKICHEDSFYLLYPQGQVLDYLVEDSSCFGCIDGWGGCIGLDDFQGSVRSFFESIRDKGNLTEGITGSFSGFLYEKQVKQLTIFSDPGGMLPFYYSNNNNIVLGGTSLILTGRIMSAELDITGVVERISPPDYVNYGSRTILKNIFRLLPGEIRTYDDDMHYSIKFDDGLYALQQNNRLPEAAYNLWQIIKSDVGLCVKTYDKVNVGMGGGWDSRIIANALDAVHKRQTFFTYGMARDEYEVVLAQRCAEVLGANFIFCDVYPSYFPAYEEFIDNMRFGEGTLVTPFFSILQKAEGFKEPILLGDMFEAIVGRNIKSLTSRRSRIRGFINPPKMTTVVEANSANFKEWSMMISGIKVREHWKQISLLSPSILSHVDVKDIVDQLFEDISVTLKRISANNPPYTMLYDELFAWFTHGQAMGRQFLTLKKSFTPLPATMGVRTIRETISIDPVSRANGRLMHEIQMLPEFKKLSSIPSTSIPYIPSSSPLKVKNIVWGGRSIVDQLLINNALKRRNPKARRRVVKSLDITKLYCHPDALERVKSWFSGELFANADNFTEVVKHRASSLSWPLINMDIVGPASTSILVDLLFR